MLSGFFFQLSPFEQSYVYLNIWRLNTIPKIQITYAKLLWFLHPRMIKRVLIISIEASKIFFPVHLLHNDRHVEFAIIIQINYLLLRGQTTQGWEIMVHVQIMFIILLVKQNDHASYFDVSFVKKEQIRQWKVKMLNAINDIKLLLTAFHCKF